MNLVFNCSTSNMGLNEVRETEFLNFCQTHGMKNLKDHRLWIAPQDMLVLNARIVMKLYAIIMNQDYDMSLRREV